MWSHPFFQCLHNNYGSLHTWHTYEIIHTLHHNKFRHCDINRQYLGHHKHCIHDIRSPKYDITCTVYDTSFTIPVISPTVLDITATASVWSHPLYQCLHNNYGSLHNWHTYDIIHTLHHIKFRLYDINREFLGHHKHCIHDIRSPIYDITSTVYDISSPTPVTSQPLYR